MTELNRYQITKKASLISALTNSSLAITKIIVGYFGLSTALIADGLHSFSDLLADGLVIIAAKAGARLPDQEHPYGHQRIETIATILIAVALLIIATLIGWESAQHLIHRTPPPTPKYPVIFIAILSVLANEWLFYYTLKIGKKINSNLLISNAWHNRTDSFASLIVLVGAGGALLGFHYLDAIGAIIITLLILKIGIMMIWNSFKELIDTGVDAQTLKNIYSCIETVPGVLSVHQLRTRTHGISIFIDVHIMVDSKISVSEGHHIGDRVHLDLMQKIKNVSDVIVHIDPEDDENTRPSLHLPSREEVNNQLAACWKNLPHHEQIKKINLHYLNGELYIEVFMPQSIALGRKRKLIQTYQNAACNLQNIAQITFYFEP